jgi:pimeloyl-ACP methyl ester carboxylesterase
VAGILALDSERELGRVVCPTLLLWGEPDSIFGREQQERLCKSIAHARLVVLAETGHAPHWERPGRVAAELVAFLGAAADGG